MSLTGNLVTDRQLKTPSAQPQRSQQSEEQPERDLFGAVECTHCGLPVPSGLIVARAAEQFCCSGCRAAYTILKGAGLDEYYAFRARLGEEGRPAEEAPTAGFGQFDTQAFQQLYCTTDEQGVGTTELLLEGVHCAACVWLVERLPRLEPSVKSARLNMARRVVELEWQFEGPGAVPLSQVAKSLSQMGYRPRPARGQGRQEVERRELRSLLVRMGVAGASAGNVMLMAFALYSGAAGVEHTAGIPMSEAGTMSEGTRRFFEWASLLVSLPALWAGWSFIRGGWSSIRTRVPHMDLPIALGILAGYAYGAFGVVAGRGEIYFDSITALIFFLLVGRYLQTRHQMRAGEAAELLHAVTPADALRLPAQEGMDPETVSAAELAPGDRVLVLSGAVVPIDGVVESGSSLVDRALLSGESLPVPVAEGSEVEAGCLNVGSELVLVAQKTGAETRVARLMLDVERALSTRAPLVALADRIAGAFTISVIALAAAAFFFWMNSSLESALDHALAILIVACPCALGLATPLALSSAVGQAARSHKLIFGAETVEALAQPATIVLDKTGTLTEGKLGVTAVSGNRDFDAIVLAMERGAHHPVGRALVSWLEQQGISDDGVLQGEAVQEVLGQGLEVQVDGAHYRLGSQAFVAPAAELSGALSIEAGPVGASPVLLSVEGRVVAVYWLADQVRPDAADSLRALQVAGHRLVLLSGDNRRTVAAVALQLAGGDSDFWQEALGEVTPEQKLAYVEALEEAGTRAFMVGDGVNDAGALARATVGIAVSGAAEASQLSADVFLSRPGVAQLVELLEGSARTLSAIRRGIGFSLAYNALGVTLAALGFLGPLGAAVLMPLSSLTVVTNAYRSRMFRSPSESAGA